MNFNLAALIIITLAVLEVNLVYVWLFFEHAIVQVHIVGSASLAELFMQVSLIHLISLYLLAECVSFFYRQSQYTQKEDIRCL